MICITIRGHDSIYCNILFCRLVFVFIFSYFTYIHLLLKVVVLHMVYFSVIITVFCCLINHAVMRLLEIHHLAAQSLIPAVQPLLKPTLSKPTLYISFGENVPKMMQKM